MRVGMGKSKRRRERGEMTERREEGRSREERTRFLLLTALPTPASSRAEESPHGGLTDDADSAVKKMYNSSKYFHSTTCYTLGCSEALHMYFSSFNSHRKLK